MGEKFNKQTTKSNWFQCRVFDFRTQFFQKINFINMKQKLLSILLLCTLLVGTAYAQSRTISGTVTSAEDGSTLPGVSVTVQGSSVGTQTNADGVYTLSVSADARALVFSYIGFTSQTVNIGNNTTVNVSLETDAQTLADVVVVGYGTSTK
jgi:hypothetical protein